MWPRILVTAIAAMAAGAGARAPAPPHGAVSLAVAPSRIEVVAGRPSVHVFQIQNTSAHAETVIAAKEPFRQDPAGGIVFYRDGGYQWGGSWLTITPGRLTIPAGKVRPVTVRVDAPRDAEPGDRYVGVIFKAPAQRRKQGQASIVIDAGVGVQIVIRVPGNVIRRQRMTLSAPSFSVGGGVPLTLTVANTGTVYALDSHVTASTGTRFDGMLVLAGATRTESARWSDPPAICLPCHVTVGDAVASVWIIPVWEITAALLVIAGSALTARRLTRLRRSGGGPGQRGARRPARRRRLALASTGRQPTAGARTR
jgi:hypothetical protein